MKKVITLLIVLLLICMISGCGCEHEFTDATCTEPATCTKCGKTEGEPLGHIWSDATCVDPRTCIVCGATEGNPLGHKWIDATCTEPKTCSVCGKEDGKPLGHDVDSWETVTVPTCTEKGAKQGFCSRCSETVTQELNKLPHNEEEEWEITEKPTSTKNGVRVKRCKDCGVIVSQETFEPTEEERKALYISECKSIPYKDLERTPDKYKGEKVKYSGYVVQIASETTSKNYYSSYRVATSGKYDNILFVYIDNYGAEERILEGDYISFYGTYDGIFSYESVRGDTVSIPSVKAVYYKQ